MLSFRFARAGSCIVDYCVNFTKFPFPRLGVAIIVCLRATSDEAFELQFKNEGTRGSGALVFLNGSA